MATRKNEFEAFDDVMEKLLQVPHSELQKKLDEEKHDKKKKKHAATKGHKGQARDHSEL